MPFAAILLANIAAMAEYHAGILLLPPVRGRA